MTEPQSERPRRRRRRPAPGPAPTDGPKAPSPAGDEMPAAPRAAPAPTPDSPRRGRAPRDSANERGLRDIVGTGPSQLGVSGALRGRDVNRPTQEDLAEAERDLVIVRRNWSPDTRRP